MVALAPSVVCRDPNIETPSLTEPMFSGINNTLDYCCGLSSMVDHPTVRRVTSSFWSRTWTIFPEGITQRWNVKLVWLLFVFSLIEDGSLFRHLITSGSRKHRLSLCRPLINESSQSAGMPARSVCLLRENCWQSDESPHSKRGSW